MFKKIRTILIQMAIGGVVGFFAALLIIPFIETFIDTFKTTDFIFIIFFFLLHIETGIMIHESGHLVMGT